jgi:hypothetical protein
LWYCFCPWSNQCCWFPSRSLSCFGQMSLPGFPWKRSPPPVIQPLPSLRLVSSLLLPFVSSQLPLEANRLNQAFTRGRAEECPYWGRHQDVTFRGLHWKMECHNFVTNENPEPA